MDLNDLKRKVQAARQFTVEVGAGRVVTLQRPSRFDLQMAGAKAGMSGGAPGSRLQWERLVLSGAVVGWQGITVADFGAHEADAVAFDPEAVSMLLDAQPEWADQLSEALWMQLAKAEDVEGTAAKN